jgi:hypothetical protein
MKLWHISSRIFIPILTIILILSLVMMPEMVSAQWDYEENPIADTDISQNLPNRNGGQSSTSIDVQWASPNAYRILVLFDLSSIPPGSIITDASLSLHAGGYLGSGERTFTVYRVSKSWVEGDGPSGGGTTGATWIDTDKSVPISWSTPGGDFVSEGASSADLTLGFGRQYFNVTDIVTAWVTDGRPNYGFLIKVDNEAGAGAGFSFRPREFGEPYDPILQINWEAPPEETTPVGGLSIPVNNFVILAPYLVLTGLIVVVSAVYVINRRKD